MEKLRKRYRHTGDGIGNCNGFRVAAVMTAVMTAAGMVAVTTATNIFFWPLLQ